jgi:hypothetical protein
MYPYICGAIRKESKTYLLKFQLESPPRNGNNEQRNHNVFGVHIRVCFSITFWGLW